MFGLDSPVHWIILLVIVVVIFGTKKLRNVGSDLGAAVKGFKDGVKGAEDKPASQTDSANTATSQLADKTTIDVEVKEKAKS